MQQRQRSTFFSVFYLCINGGSLLSTIITPILRGEWNRNFNNLSDLMGGLNLLFSVCVPSAAQECGIHKKQECYPLAFGVPAALMVIALGMPEKFQGSG